MYNKIEAGKLGGYFWDFKEWILFTHILSYFSTNDKFKSEKLNYCHAKNKIPFKRRII
jgi:hypothetical protein